MFIESPSSIDVSFNDFAKFTHDVPTMDFVDITYTAGFSEDIASPEISQGEALPNIGTPGSFVYRLDLTLDNDKLQGTDVVGISLEISPKDFSFFINIISNIFLTVRSGVFHLLFLK